MYISKDVFYEKYVQFYHSKFLTKKDSFLVKIEYIFLLQYTETEETKISGGKNNG